MVVYHSDHQPFLFTPDGRVAMITSHTCHLVLCVRLHASPTIRALDSALFGHLLAILKSILHRIAMLCMLVLTDVHTNLEMVCTATLLSPKQPALIASSSEETLFRVFGRPVSAVLH